MTISAKAFKQNKQSNREQQIPRTMTNSAQNDKVSREWQPYPGMTLAQNNKSANLFYSLFKKQD